jgi:hypothetical protein
VGDISAADPSEPVELIGGVEKREIKVVPPDPTWPAKFAKEREKILTALGVKAVRVDHIGSTSVPGLAATPHPGPHQRAAHPHHQQGRTEDQGACHYARIFE